MQTRETIKQRLAEFLAHLDIGQAKFAEKVGLSKGFANNVGDSIRADNLEKIGNAYPELDLIWLQTGRGEMLKTTQTGDYNTSISGTVSGHNHRIGGYHADPAMENVRLIEENKRLSAQVVQLTDDNRKLIERINYLTDKLIDNHKI